MNFDDYQIEARKTAIYPDIGFNLVYPVLGLNGEAGEIAEKVKKYIRDGTEFAVVRDQIIAELGDVLWYLSALCSELNVPMSEIAQSNLNKLQNRAKRNKLSGSGDDR